MPSLVRSRFLYGAALWAATMAASGQSFGQTKPLALDRFDPAPAGDRAFGVPSPFAAGSLTPHVMVLADYAHNPLVLRSSESNDKLGNVVTDQFFLHANAALALWNRVNVNFDLPFALYQSGGSPMIGAQTFSSPSGAEIGDLRLGLRVLLVGKYTDPFQIAIGGYVWAPTAKSAGFVGTGQARGLPQLILGGFVADRVHWSVAGGPEIEKSQTFGGIQQGAMMKWGAAVAVALLDNRHLQIGAETSGASALKNANKHNLNAEAMGTLRYRLVDDLEVGAGIGPGITSGIGTPDFRGVFMVAYTPEKTTDRDGDGIVDRQDACPDEPGPRSDDPAKNGCPLKDRDGDGITDVDDACPDEPGPRNDDPAKNGCPLKDRDGDGITDDVDACPDVKGVADPDPKKNGCPKDTDGDGILDEEDACPEQPGPKSDDPAKNGCPDRDGDGITDDVDACPDVKGVADPDPKKNGCPKDTDGDGIFDDVDACPQEKGVPDPDPKKNGCPRSVRVSETEIVIFEQVQFETGKATIKRASDALLDEVANVLKEHPEILTIEVQGHTDSRGTKAGNKVLSQQRADAVQKALISRSVASARLTAKGYGQDVPIDDNTTDAGRQKNRRVQFKILAKQPKEKP